jgi:hypothetical protein
VKSSREKQNFRRKLLPPSSGVKQVSSKCWYLDPPTPIFRREKSLFYQTTRRHILKDHDLYIHTCDNRRLYIISYIKFVLRKIRSEVVGFRLDITKFVRTSCCTLCSNTSRPIVQLHKDKAQCLLKCLTWIITVTKSRRIINLLTSQSKVLRKKPTRPQLVKKLSVFYETCKFITVFTTARHLFLSWARSKRSLHPIPALQGAL